MNKIHLNKSSILGIVALSLLLSITASAEITTRECPYSCRTQGIPKKVCKDWKEAGLCYIDDLRKNPGKPAPHGYIDPKSRIQPPQTPPPPQKPHLDNRYDHRHHDYDRHGYDHHDYDRRYDDRRADWRDDGRRMPPPPPPHRPNNNRDERRSSILDLF